MNNIYDDKQFFDQYAKMTRSKKGLEGAVEWNQFKAMFPNLSEKQVLDLGCGYGWHCKYALECGARMVLGIDLSEKMIEEAKVRNPAQQITYQVCGLEEYEYPVDSFDCVISNLVLHYVADIDMIYKKIHRTLKESGVLLINIEHPVFTAGVNQEWIYGEDQKPLYWPVDDYFYPGERLTNFLGEKVKKQHHTLTQILMGLINAGFRIEEVNEAMPIGDITEKNNMSEEMRRPMMLLIKAVKR